jgi:hypothetical protein
MIQSIGSHIGLGEGECVLINLTGNHVAIKELSRPVMDRWQLLMFLDPFPILLLLLLLLPSNIWQQKQQMVMNPMKKKNRLGTGGHK